MLRQFLQRSRAALVAAALVGSTATPAFAEFEFDVLGFDLRGDILTPGATWDSSTGVVTVLPGVSFFDLAVSIENYDGPAFGPFYDELEQPMAIEVPGLRVDFVTPGTTPAVVKLAEIDFDPDFMGPGMPGEDSYPSTFTSTMVPGYGAITFFGVIAVDPAAGMLFKVRFEIDPVDTSAGPVDTFVTVTLDVPVGGDPMTFRALSAAGPGPLDFTIRVVPEPSTWALMVGGLGLIGFAARRRVRAH
jgi:hypothetical protein